MRRHWRLMMVVLLIAVPLVFLLRGFARDVLVVELLRIVWALGVVLESLPQTPVWWLFLGLVAFLAVRSLFGRVRLRRPRPATEKQYTGQVRLLASQIQRAGEGEYFRWSLARDLARRALEVLAYRHQTTVADFRKRLDRDGFEAPPAVVAYILSGQAPVYSLSAGIAARLGRRFSPGPGPAAVEQDVERIVQFMEAQLEAAHDGRVG